MAGLTFEAVRKDFGSTTAVADLDLEVGDGELLALVGPSGSGKTTVLRLAAGLEHPTAGSISIGDREVTALSPGERGVSMVFQGYALFPHHDVRGNIGFGLAVRKVPKAEIRRRVEEASRLAGCSHLLDRQPHQLSGGERQRAALARALAREPAVFLLDEPLSNLDARLRVEVRAELQQLHRSTNTTTVHVTHDQVEALTLGDRLAVLDGGRLQQLGTPDDVYLRPANRFVATFIGSPPMNIIPASIMGERLVADPFVLPLPRGGSSWPSQSVELGIRPEDVVIGSHEAAGTAARVRLVERAGSDTYVHLDAGDHALVARTGPDVRPLPGSELPVALAAEKVHVFDLESGQALFHPA